jgi:hypothetical protein
MQDVGAAFFLIQSTLDRLDLAADAAHSVQELELLAFRMGHD